MRKTPTIFIRDQTRPGHPVTREVNPDCDWVLAGEGLATVKLDGTNVRIVNGQLEKRQKPTDRDYDHASYVPCDRANPADRWAWEAFDAGHEGDGIYELVGPKVQGNPQHAPTHQLVRVVPPADWLQPDLRGRMSFEGLQHWLASNPVEGLVFHHPDGRLAKIKRRDFGLPWPAGDR